MSIKLESNTHFSKAKFLQGGVHEWQSDAGQTEATMICTALDALIESNLAVAYEQRTANLMAFERSQWEAWRHDELDKEGHEVWVRAAAQVAERLDLV